MCVRACLMYIVFSFNFKNCSVQRCSELGKQSGRREAALLPVLGVERASKNPPQHRPLPWAQHERAFNELSENFFFFYKNEKNQQTY